MINNKLYLKYLFYSLQSTLSKRFPLAFSLAIIFILFLCFSQPLLAVGNIRLSIEQLLFDTSSAVSDSSSSQKKNGSLYQLFQLDQLEVDLDINSIPFSLSLNLSKIKLPEPFEQLTSAKLICRSFAIKNNNFSCAEGIINTIGLFPHTPQTEASKADAKFSFDYDLAENKLFLTIEDLMIGKGKVSIKLNLVNNLWVVAIDANNLDYKHLKQYLSYYIAEQITAEQITAEQITAEQIIAEQIKNFADAGGKISFSARLSGRLPADDYPVQSLNNNNLAFIESAKINGHIEQLHYSYNDNMAENLGFKFNLNLNLNLNPDFNHKNKTASKTPEDKTQKSISSATYQIYFSIENPRGEIYQNDIYLVYKGNESLQFKLNYQPDEQRISFDKIKLVLPGILHLQSNAMVNITSDYTAINKFKTDLIVQDLALLNDNYLKNILEGTDYEGLDVDGKINVEVKYLNEVMTISSEINELSLEFKGLFSFADINGHLFWNNKINSSVRESRISWESAVLNKLPLGNTLINFISHNDQFSLTKEIEIALFDGSLNINRLDINNIGNNFGSNFGSNFINNTVINTGQASDADKKLSVIVEGMINPISLSQVSEHFNWPILDGTLSAIIPSTTYNEDHFEIGGAMLLQVFDGAVIIKDLNIEHPLQDYARLEANIDLTNLDLQSLTKTYNFGEIQGRLEGNFSNLVLQSWLPVSFDAYIRTPENDKSKHRISQRAIDNLSSLGGASGLLSRSFLSFFKTFSYNKIGLSCKLKNNICSMSGVEAKGEGYYIVKGGGVPRIDVMGFQDRVNWQVLINRLKAIQSVNEAVIE